MKHLSRFDIEAIADKYVQAYKRGIFTFADRYPAVYQNTVFNYCIWNCTYRCFASRSTKL